MARIAGKDIPDNKKIKVSLRYVFGIGETKANEILKTLKIDGEILTKNLTEDQLNKIRNFVESEMTVEGELKQTVKRNIKRLVDIRSYRGLRHKLGLPVRGQRTRHNAHTRKGRAQPVGGLKRVLTKT